ncbi:MAG TPA: response regulator [Clostridiales bacterium]|nr:MAG: signal transduction protein [Clostridiales bacterium GWD2_32_19]HCC07497.1 response regulator [Clostridiales bacterium]
MKKILFVDDEEQILKTIIRLFRTTDYDLYTAMDGEKALEVLAREDIDLIISDMRMPYMDGYELLYKVKTLYPKIARIILSGYADEKIIFKAIQKNIAKMYIFKPWEDETLLNIVNQVFAVEEIINDERVMTYINNIEELPIIKANYRKIVSLIQEDADIKDITNEIEIDHQIVLKILHVANSAYCGVETKSVDDAISYLGLHDVSNIVISTSVIDAISYNGIAESDMDILWRHAFITNQLVNFIYDNILRKKINQVHNTAGLLHDVGRVFLFNSFKEKYAEVYQKSLKEALDIGEVERDMLGITHEEVGGYLLKRWDLPHSIVEAAFFHHRPMDDRIIDKELVCVVHLADYYSWKVTNEKNATKLIEEVFEYLNINKSMFEEELGKIKID